MSLVSSMSLEGHAAIKKIVANMTRLADWNDANRPSVDRLTLSKADWTVVMKHRESGTAYGIRYTEPPTFKGFELHCHGDAA